MRLFIDTGSVAEVEEIAAWGVLAGATTNPSLLAKEDGDPGEIIRGSATWSAARSRPRSSPRTRRAWSPRAARCASCTSTSPSRCRSARQGLEATHALTADGIPVNMTLVFSANQAMLAASAGATYVSCFMGRLDDISVDSGQVVAEIVECFRAGGVTSQIIAASIRHPST